MSFFVTPNSAQASEANSVPTTFIDILYNHRKYLEDHDGLLAKEDCLAGKKIAIVGGGPAGLLAAYQLLSLGAYVDIYEASSSVGGRVDSVHPKVRDSAIFEMGAMRVPPCEQLFDFYANKFGMQSQTFPDPGKVPTQLIYNNKVYAWSEGQPAPELFRKISQDWSWFVREKLLPIKSLLASGEKQDYEYAADKWQKLVYGDEYQGHYSEVSFYDGVRQTFGKDWSYEDLLLFGTLGLGSGGFGPLYPVNFSEIVRLIINGLESDQRFFPNGVGELIYGFFNDIVELQGSENTRGNIFLNCTVNSVMNNDGRVLVSSSNNQSSEVEQKTYDSAIIATTTRAMQIDLNITSKVDGQTKAVLSEKSKAAIEGLHLMNSSKLFVLTKTKFWKEKNTVQNIQTDGLVRGLYCLDYPESEHGVVLISYTWGDDSTKLLALKDPVERMEYLLRSLENLSPEFVAALRESISQWDNPNQYVKMIDWQDTPHYYGAFKLNYPGQDVLNQELYYQFLDKDSNVYLAGDSISFSGGWIEGALQTGMNAAAAVVYKHSDYGLYEHNPVDGQREGEHRFKYASR